MKKMGSRTFLLFGLLLAIAFLISSEVVAARDLAEISTEKEIGKASTESNGVGDAKHMFGGYQPPCGYGGYQPPAWGGYQPPNGYGTYPPPCGCGGYKPPYGRSRIPGKV